MTDMQTATEGSNEPDRPIGTKKRTGESVVRATFASLGRGELTRYLEPGETINLPADRVKVEVLDR